MVQDNPVDICIIEDDHNERALLIRRFERMGHSLVAAADGQSGLELIRQHRPAIVVCDVMLPDMSGIELCDHLRNAPELDGTYVVMITAYDSQKRKRDALHAGADDYLIKPYDTVELEAKVRNGLRIAELQQRLRRAAVTDPLTGLWNHGQFRDLLDNEFARTRRYGGAVSLLMLDLDHFKAVNDTYGHEVGNVVLKSAARHIAESVRDIDSVARYGGEEFAVVCPQTRLEEATNLAERIRASLAEQLRVAAHPELHVYASIGVACSTDADVMSAEDLAAAADQALYVAKTHGRNQVRTSGEVKLLEEPPEVQVVEVDRLRKQVVALSMQAKELCLQSVWALVQALEARDPFTAEHSRNVTYYVEQLVEAAGWPENLRVATVNAAMLHDLGKIGVPDHVLQKPTPLKPSEMAILRKVPAMSCKILEPLRVFETETLIIRHLRERWDGSGAPDHLRGDAIPIGSRLLMVAEAFDALTCDRAHRPGRSLDESLAIIAHDAGSHFDPEFTELITAVAYGQRAQWQKRIDDSLSIGGKASLVPEHS